MLGEPQPLQLDAFPEALGGALQCYEVVVAVGTCLEVLLIPEREVV